MWSDPGTPPKSLAVYCRPGSETQPSYPYIPAPAHPPPTTPMLPFLCRRHPRHETLSSKSWDKKARLRKSYNMAFLEKGKTPTLPAVLAVRGQGMNV